MPEGAIQRIEMMPERRDLAAIEADTDSRARIDQLVHTYLDAGVIGVGTTANVYSEPPGMHKSAWCAKVTTAHLGRTMNLAPREELLIQHEAYQAIVDARTANPARALARIPTPIAYVETVIDGRAQPLFIMERIVGKTVFRILLEHIVRADERCADLRGEVDTMADDILEQEFLIRFNLRGKPTRNQLQAIVELGKQSGFTVPRDTVLRARETLTALHAQGIYHRDCHPRNLMLDANTGEPYLIDFGKSTRVGAGTDPGGVYEDWFGEQRLVFSRDEELVIFLRNFMPPVGTPERT